MTKDLQHEINQLKNEVKYLKNEVLNLKTNDLTLEAKLALLQNPPQLNEIPLQIPVEISQISDKEIPNKQFIQTISKITFQKWFSIVTLMVEDSSTNIVALIDSGADVNCIKREIVPTKYCEKSNERLASANGMALTINYKLNKGYIKADDYCFKNTFLIVDNMTSDLILGTPFLTQIYPFYVNDVGLHTKIMGKTISFKFLTAAKQREIASLQSSSIYKQINTITSLHEKVKSLQHILHHVKQRVQAISGLGILHPHTFILSLHGLQQNCSTNKKEIFALIFIIFKFQNDLFIKRFLSHVNLKSSKEILQKDIQNLVSKQIFARWQAISFAFDFDIEFIKGKNSLPDFRIGKFLQGKSDTNISMQEDMSSSKNKKNKGKAIQQLKTTSFKFLYKINLHP